MDDVMTGQPTAKRAESEAALRLLRYTHLDYLESDRQPRTWGRLSRYSTSVSGRFDPVEARRQGHYLRLISIVEAYIDLLAEELTLKKTPRDSVTVQWLIEELDRR